MSTDRGPAVTVFAPTLVLTVVIEPAAGNGELHLHAGGQGLWIARMAASLGGRVTLCTALGGETGRVLSALLADEDIEVRDTTCRGASGSYVHDRRSGERVAVAEIPETPLRRHEIDDLYDASLVSALAARALVLTGPQSPGTFPGDVYRRLAADALGNRVPVIADLTGEPLADALAGGVTLAKLSDVELVEEGLAGGPERAALVTGMEELVRRGAANVLISRGPEGSLALVEGTMLEIRGPRLTAADPRGAGDSMTAAATVAVARGQDLVEAMRMAAAAGALNVTRHGLGTGDRAEIEALLPRVQVSGVG